MRLALITLIAVASLAVATKLPAAGESSATIVTTAAEARLIDRLREMAQPPQVIESVLPEPTEVAMAPVPARAGRAETETLVVVPAALNVRAEPSTDGVVLGRLKQGEAVKVAARDNGWVQVATPDGTVGWASAEYMATVN